MDRYDLKERLFVDSFPENFLAIEKSSRQPRAIKRILFKQDDMTFREFHVHSSLNHPHIIQCYEGFLHESYADFVIEFPTGGTLRDYLNNKTITPEKQLLS